MWTCTKCGERIEESFDSCWKCSTPRADTTSDAPKEDAETPNRRLAHRMFRGTWTSWEALFKEAAEFATGLGPDRLVNISHSADSGEGVVVVWYWTHEEDTA